MGENFRDLDALAAATSEELTALPDIGPEVAASIREFFGNAANRQLIERFRQLKLWPVSEPKAAPPAGTTPLAGRKFLFTGTLPDMSREAAQALVEAAGGRVVSGISKKLDYLVVGADPGSKLAKAQALGLTILSPEDFQTLLSQSGTPVPTRHSLRDS